MADQSFTIKTWCATRKVSRSKFYELDRDGKAPRTHNAGSKRLISPQADQDWMRCEREAEAAAAANTGTTWAERLDDSPTEAA